MGRRPLLIRDKALQDRIVTYIRAGAYDYVAAEACGVPMGTFYRWLQQGEATGAPKVYRDFHDAVRQAQQEARVTAEAAVKAAEPWKWLRYGPGKTKPGRDGWSDPERVAVGGDAAGEPLRLVIDGGPRDD